MHAFGITVATLYDAINSSFVIIMPRKKMSNRYNSSEIPLLDILIMEIFHKVFFLVSSKFPFFKYIGALKTINNASAVNMYAI